MRELNLYKFLQVFKLNIKKIILIVFILDLLLLGYTFIMPQMYKSELSIMPPKGSSSGGALSSFISNIAGSALSFGGMSESKSGLYADILKSKSVTGKVINKLRLDTLSQFSKVNRLDLQGMLASSVEVDVEKSGIIRLVCEMKTDYLASNKDVDFTKNLVKVVTDAFASSLDDVLKEKSNSTAKNSRIYIEGEIAKYNKQLDSVAFLLQNFQETNNVLEIEEQTKAIVQSAIDIGSQIIKAEYELNLAKLQMSPNSEKVNILKEQVELLKSQYTQVQSGGLGSDKFSIPLSKVPDLARQFATLYRDRTILEKVILYLETQKHQEYIQEEKDTPVIEVLDDAYLPFKKSAPQRSLILILGTIIFLAGTSIFVVYKAYKKGALLEN